MRWKPDDAPKGPALPPGAEVMDAPPAKAPGDMSKSALKKQKQKQKEAARAELSSALDQVKALNMSAGGAAAAAVEEEIDWPKRLKAVQKKLRQLDDLRAAQDSGQELNADQLLKLQGRAALEEEQQQISNKMKVHHPRPSPSPLKSPLPPAPDCCSKTRAGTMKVKFHGEQHTRTCIKHKIISHTTAFCLLKARPRSVKYAQFRVQCEREEDMEGGGGGDSASQGGGQRSRPLCVKQHRRVQMRLSVR